MNVEIDLNEYLTHEDKKRIAEEEYRQAIRSVVAVDKERILSNAAYTVVQKLIDEQFGEDMNQLLVEKVKHIIDNLSSYNVFKCKDAWDRDESKGWAYLQQAMDDNKDLIDNRVKSIVKEWLTLESREDMIQEIAQDAVYNVIRERLTGEQHV